MKQCIQALAGLGLLLGGGLAMAQALPAGGDADVRRYAQELDDIKQSQRERLLHKQQLETEKLRVDLARLRGGQIYVLALTGAGKQLTARLGVNGVGEVSVRSGDSLPGGWRILKISDQAVTARQPDGSQVILPFYAE
ncbi:type IV pilus biogenesis protein PilP [Chromobacterium violaceum]|uniref:type IV pilus biogenesis protein PilP n=1 Tax=Chromobacterium violaceum TaxID=536 RepID=UPI0009D9E366|nr:type IV pilus biogenesis protein PilP [Chromobacterium violaceum]MBP4052095.1 type IV pilus biogenesis protein PilP [Chromobacterium violaceum]OQS20462.1 hypothetical protein B0T41_21715 [Chromobacterium violaceum]